MQFQDIECHEDEAEIHCDPGFPEMTEARVTVIVLELPEDRFRLPRPSFELFPIRGQIKPGLCLTFFPEVP